MRELRNLEGRVSREGNENKDSYSIKCEQIIKAAGKRETNLLRKLCKSDGGLVKYECRKVAWPLLTNLEHLPRSKVSKIKDSVIAQVKRDVERSFGAVLESCTQEHASKLRNRLLGLILYVLGRHPWMSYYQGYHDIAGVILLAFDNPGDPKDLMSKKVLDSLSLFLVRDHLSPSIYPTCDYLQLLSFVLDHSAPASYRHLVRLKMESLIFALSWISTMFSHTVFETNRVPLFPAFDSCPESKTSDNELGEKNEDDQGNAPNKVQGHISNSVHNQSINEKEQAGHALSLKVAILRIFDFLISSDPCMSVYMAAAIINKGIEVADLNQDLNQTEGAIFTREDYKLLDTDGNLNGLLNEGGGLFHQYMNLFARVYITRDLEGLIKNALNLYQLYPLESLVVSFRKENLKEVLKSISVHKNIDDYLPGSVSHALISDSSCIVRNRAEGGGFAVTKVRFKNINPVQKHSIHILWRRAPVATFSFEDLYSFARSHNRKAKIHPRDDNVERILIKRLVDDSCFKVEHLEVVNTSLRGMRPVLSIGSFFCVSARMRDALGKLRNKKFYIWCPIVVVIATAAISRYILNN